MDVHADSNRDTQADGPDYTAAYLAGRANGATDAGMDAYIEAAEQAHADGGNRGAAGNDFAGSADAQAGDSAVPA